MAGYLAWASLSNGPLAGCGPESGCDKVLQSRWAYWLGIPVSIPAFLTYAGLLAATFGISSGSAPARQQTRWTIIVTLAVLVIGAALWFVGLQAFVLKSFCPFCVTAHVSGLVASALLLYLVPIHVPSGKPRSPEAAIALTSALRNKFAFLGACGLAVLVTGQAFVTKQRHQVQKMAESASLTSPKNEPRKLSLHDGRFQLVVDDVPIIGSPHASNIMVSLFDYSCHICRDMHAHLVEVQQRFSNQLGIVSLPMPLDGKCNPHIRRTSTAHTNACEYAKLALAVWRANRDAFHQFDSWIFAPPQPAPVHEVKQYAASLVGSEKLEAALTNSWVNGQLQTNVAIYAANSRSMTNSRMPQLIVGHAITAGAIERVDELYSLLAQQFGLKRTP